MENATKITVEVIVDAPVQKVWEFWNEPEHIKQWAFASPDWHTPYADNDLKTGGKFKTTMAAKDGSFSFDFGGTYTNVEVNKLIEYVLDDERKVDIHFLDLDGSTKVVETFEAETTNSVEMQRGGWEAILHNFKKHVESN